MVDDFFLLTSPTSPCFSPTHPRKADGGLHMTSAVKANTPATLKRTYTLVSQSNPPSPSDQQYHHHEDRPHPFKVPALVSPSRHSPRHMSLSLKRRYPFCKSPTAPAIVTPASSTAGPSFVSIFDLDVDMSGCSPSSTSTSSSSSTTTTTTNNNNSQHTIQHKTPPPPPSSMSQDPLSLHHEHGSISTSASSSTNSSPTTTISTLESAITDDHTPDSSPDTVVPTIPMSAFRSKHAGIPSSEDLSIVPPSPLPAGYTRSLSPSKKPRNTKNLSLKPLTMSTTPIQAIGEGADNKSVNGSPRSMSAPTSPAFIKPPPPPQNPRRRPSNLGLTIKLPGTLPEKTAVQGAPPAGGITALRHHQSSPSLFSPAHGGIPGGMKLPPTPGFQRPGRLFSPPRPVLSTFTAQDSLSSSLSSSSISNSPPKSPDILHEMEEEDEEPRSGEAKSPAYPAGPVCIFEPNIYLYAEPDAELAAKFDVVINVAREVVNPLKATAEAAPAPTNKHFSGAFDATQPPDTACTEASFTTAFEEAVFSPKTGRMKQPEYVHMLWDHNTPILDDLPGLVTLIDERAAAGKKVLVHCQCGVSRSATLLIAYSMYKNPEKTMQDAYSAVKARSRWIGPNMSLIYQLTDWKKKIASDGTRGGGGGWRMGGPAMAGGVRGLVKSGTRNGFGRAGTMDEERMSEAMPEPQTAPLPEMRKTPSPPPPSTEKSSRTKDHPIPHMVRTRSENGGFISGVSPGPSSAPPGMITIPGTDSVVSSARMSWPEPEPSVADDHPRAPSPPPSWAALARQREKEDSGFAPVPPPPLPPSAAYLVQRAEKEIFGRNPVQEDDEAASAAANFTSPRSSAYFGVPIRRSGGFFFSDPRSPTQRGGEPPIVRSIFDVL